MLVSRNSELSPEFNENGLSRVEILPGASADMKAYKCVLKAGKTWTPELYAYGDRTQFFAFVTPTGYVSTDYEAWNITDPANFVPNYDAEAFTIHSGRQDLEFYHFVGLMNEYDLKRMDYIHIELPRFRLFKDGWRYTEGFTGGIGSTCESHHVMEHRFMGRYSMGWNIGEGPSVIGQHIHEDLDQWYFILPGGSMTYTTDEGSVHVTGGDVTYTKMGVSHGSSIEAGERFDYFWVELAPNGYQG